MKLLSLVFAMIFSIATYAQEANWLTDLSQAQSRAEKADKMILLNFSGSDWCASCMRLEKDLFSTDAFKSFATENLVLLKADFPKKRGNELSEEQQEHNNMLAEKYNRTGAFPTTILLDAEGTQIAKFSPSCKDVNTYIGEIAGALEK